MAVEITVVIRIKGTYILSATQYDPLYSPLKGRENIVYVWDALPGHLVLQHRRCHWV